MITLDLIREQLAFIETEENVRVIYACESGSRAWGFPSADSDYDVRFVYIHPRDWYLSIAEQRDVIERPISEGLDLNGWDLRKALQLFRKSNPPLLEWLGSPIVYLEKYSLAAQLRTLAETYYSPAACIYHYLHMARGNVREYLKGERVWTKKYFYVLRPLLAIQWIEQGYGVAPTAFGTLVERLVTDSMLKTEIERLIEQKRAGAELDEGPRIPVISDFIEAEIARHEAQEERYKTNAPPYDVLDEVFRGALIEVWGEK
ncbi:MAG TPA: nucleotidyltransferase domain-containing protein [Anaerolineales bacterium]|nr:nucleotidyltransferase domain-containing protein [Anaerolineales bacterium]